MANLKTFYTKINKYGPLPSKAAIKEWPEIKGIKCYLWIGSLHEGYGIYHKKILDERRAHRIVFAIHKGKIPKHKLVCHKCDIRNCVQGNHLFLGTNKANSDDKCNKGRQAKGKKLSKTFADRKGENAPAAKLTNNQVKKIRKMYATGLYTQKELGELFEVKYQNIYSIIKKHTFKFI
jgi:ribosomal protein L19E